MLLKIEALIIPRWVFTPGKGQLADGFSRNPEERDRVRQESEEKSHMPKTLAEAFEVVAKGRLQGDLIDDAESITQMRFLMHAPATGTNAEVTSNSETSSVIDSKSPNKRSNPTDPRRNQRRRDKN